MCIVQQASIKAFIAFLLVTVSLGLSAQTMQSREYKVKAAFLFNFTKFVEWPAASFDSTEAPFIIAIAGDDPFGSFIDETVAGEKIKGHPIIVQRGKLIKDVEHCHMMFVHTTDSAGNRDGIAAMPPRVLTVSDYPDFNNIGGMIRLMTKENKIKLVINPAAIRAAELTISSKLLNVAEIFVR